MNGPFTKIDRGLDRPAQRQRPHKRKGFSGSRELKGCRTKRGCTANRSKDSRTRGVAHGGREVDLEAHNGRTVRMSDAVDGIYVHVDYFVTALLEAGLSTKYQGVMYPALQYNSNPSLYDRESLHTCTEMNSVICTTNSPQFSALHSFVQL